MGAVERVAQTLFSKLRKLCDFSAKNWDTKVNQAALGVNISFNRSIDTSPYILKHSIPPILDIDNKLGLIVIPKDKRKLITERNKNFSKYALKNIQKGQREIKEKLNIGDKVIIYRKVLGDEFKERWKDGYTIRAVIYSDAYLVSKGHSSIRVNKSHIKLDTTI